ncbi:hypothetical protein CcrColossus_gp088 [Caulobacter phage CcrColossus]|uniref:Uncharacterized protein n=1 Tax=Caulobacter phage CcrColossus TaxID=1211640 RepID=K4JVS8_9CAUD|nr:hypothetical protein CcrColossus_gp088 [Caulobacter phage CcrColossus]AFU87958.1 hypothetical protein CcrColossus_gp088 [Caulobacter phage CcrColossus]
MPITTDEKVDFLFKQAGFGVAKTETAANKTGSNETIPFPQVVFPDSVWKESNLIPPSAPVSSGGVIEAWTGANRIRATTDPTSTPNLTWLATEVFGTPASRLSGFVPPTFGSSYAVKVYIGDPNVGPAARIFPDTTGEEWVFNYTSGVLMFMGNSIPAAKTATIGSGSVTVAANGIYLELYQYVGAVGVGDEGVANGYELPLGGTSAWTGAVPLDDNTSISEAIDLINNKLGDVASDTPADGFHLVLGDVTVDGDGSWSPGAVPFTNNMPVSEGMDRLNEVLAKLIPATPPDFPNGTLSISNTAGSSPRLATGVTDNSGGGSGYVDGGAVTRITAAGINSNTFNDVGPGDVGTVAAFLNGVATATHALTGTGDNGTYSGLVIADQKDYPVSTPGFWKSIDVSLNGFAAPIGINKARISHGGAGQTNDVFFVRDALTATPAITSPSVVQAGAGTLAYSSGVPHYGTGATLTVNLSYSNLSGETYYGGSDPITITGTNSIIGSQAFDYPALGITTPIPRQTTAATAITAITVNVNPTNVHNVGVIQGVAKNVNGSSTTTTLSTTNVLVKAGSAGSRIDEMSVPVSGLGSSPNTNNAVSVVMAGGDTPAGAPSAWTTSTQVQTYDATVVAGVLKHDQTDYTNYMPSGPNYSSGRTGSQYRTFSFNRAARSTFKITIAGSYAGCWIKLPGVSDTQPNAPNGWWNAFQAYDGAGVPGEAGDTANGCALGGVMSGGSGTFTITFGTESSTNATGNQILVRLKLNAGQQVTALSFSN